MRTDGAYDWLRKYGWPTVSCFTRVPLYRHLMIAGYTVDPANTPPISVTDPGLMYG